MPSPFPGVDPFVEAQESWEGFHAVFLGEALDQIATALPENYVVRIEGRTTLRAVYSDEMIQEFQPDLFVARHNQGSGRGSATATLATFAEPVTIPMDIEVEEVREHWLEIRRLPDRTLVAVVELLSPSNKRGAGRAEYLDKRMALIRQQVHVVEVDLLLAGSRLPLRPPLPMGDYYAFVSRFDRRPNCDVYAWSIRQTPPRIPIPLKAPDPDAPLDLAVAIAESYRRSYYDRTLDYKAALELPLRPADKAWAEAVGQGASVSAQG